MKKLVALLWLAVLSNTAQAHGDLKPSYGGKIQEGKHVTLEVTIQPSMTMVYLSDHGKPLDAKGAKGELTLLNGGSKSTIKLDASGGNSLMGPGAKLAPGAKAIVKLTVPGKGDEQIRFAF